MRSVVLISLAVTFCLSLALRNFAAAQQLAESAQALIDQALALWEGTKRSPEPLPADYQAKALLERVVAEFPRTEQALTPCVTSPMATIERGCGHRLRRTMSNCSGITRLAAPAPRPGST